MADDLVARHEAVRVIAGIAAARKLHCRVRRDQTEALPAVTPGLTDAAPLENEMLDAERAQLVAHCQAGLPAADHDYLDPLPHPHVAG